MVNLEDLTPAELQYLRSKWASEITEIDKEKARKLDRLEDRLDKQAEEATAEAELEASLTLAQDVLAQLIASGAAQALIDGQQAAVDKLQDEVNSFGLSTSYVSNTDAMLQQMEMDELDQASALRTARIAAIDAL